VRVSRDCELPLSNLFENCLVFKLGILVDTERVCESMGVDLDLRTSVDLVTKEERGGIAIVWNG
jgi:hypothetical protein